jgi:hypothetical protein
MEYKEFYKLIYPVMEIAIQEAKEFKDRFGEVPYLIRSSSINQVESFEESEKIEIPEFYRRFLVDFNPNGFEIMFNGIFGIEEIKDNLKFMAKLEVPLDGLITVASDGSGNLYGIKPENEWLYFLDHESGFEIMESERIRDFYVNWTCKNISDKW